MRIMRFFELCTLRIECAQQKLYLNRLQFL